MRLPEETPARKALEVKRPKKKRERPPLTWWKTILRDTNLNLEKIEEMCQDRRIWRKSVKNVMPINIG